VVKISFVQALGELSREVRPRGEGLISSSLPLPSQSHETFSGPVLPVVNQQETLFRLQPVERPRTTMAHFVLFKVAAAGSGGAADSAAVAVTPDR
jgi:hypothetical protein